MDPKIERECLEFSEDGQELPFADVRRQRP